LLDAGPFACDFFVFDKAGPNPVSGPAERGETP
jgi:hypothetical protein